MKVPARLFWTLLVAIVLVLVVLKVQAPLSRVSAKTTALSLDSNGRAANSPSAPLPILPNRDGNIRLVALQSVGTDRLPADISVAVHPRHAPVTAKVTQQFTAVVTGNPNQAVTWYVDGHLGGNAKVGTIDSNGLYTPPDPLVVKLHIVTAVSQEDPTKEGIATVHLVDYAGMYTNRNDNSRTGQNLGEEVLAPANVNVNRFGKVFSYPIDGGVHGQVLYVANVYVPTPQNGSAGYYNVAYVATEHDSVFAFDADGNVAGPLWHASFINPPTVVPIPGSCFGVAFHEVGITASPTIDPDTKTLYVEARTLENPSDQCTGTYVHKLHALSIATGKEKFGGPVTVQASVPGTGDGSQNGTLPFDPQTQEVRPGLLLSKTSQDANKILYFGSASLMDRDPYHGWVLGYDSRTLKLKYVYCSTPNGRRGGIWQLGGGLAADADGNIYVQTGNGDVDSSQGSYGVSVLKLTPSNGTLTLGDYFTPRNFDVLNSHDWDVSSAGLMLLPPQPGKHPHIMVGGGKEGTIYVVDRDNLGQYNPDGDQLVQEIVGAIRPSEPGKGVYGIWNTPGYFQGKVYIFGHFDFPKMFKLEQGLLPTTATSTGTTMMKSPSPVFSAHSSVNGLVWILEYDVRILHAYDPKDLTHEYYNTNQNPGRDKPVGGIDAVAPTVANGRVYVPTQSKLEVYGLLP